MESDSLALFTVKDLVDELMRRRTFLGVILHSGHDCKNATWNGTHMFKVHYNSNLNAAEAAGLLSTVSEYIQQNCC
jgi:hypothetical protein